VTLHPRVWKNRLPLALRWRARQGLQRWTPWRSGKFGPLPYFIQVAPFTARSSDRRGGDQPFRGPESDGFKWLFSKTKCFGIDWKELWPHLAVLNICAYHSKRVKDTPLLAALPSCRVSIGWAQDVLFPQAEAGERVVICLRSAQFWGLKQGTQYGHSLCAPLATIGGYMKHSPMRERIIEAVKSVITG
jgi:hypothetical protein